MRAAVQAPAWHVQTWLNTPAPIELASLRGRVVVACAFQMLCPGCVQHAIPLLAATHAYFAPMGAVVVGLHTVFEHHDAMTEVALRAFLHEYRVGLPVGIDAPATDGQPLPRTMRAYAMQGTPTWLLIDRDGRLRLQVFGHIPELQLGARVMHLLDEAAAAGAAG